MIPISYLSLLGGTGMTATAVAMLGLDWYLLVKSRGRLLGTPVCTNRGAWRGALGLVLLGWGPILLAFGFVTIAGGDFGASR